MKQVFTTITIQMFQNETTAVAMGTVGVRRNTAAVTVGGPVDLQKETQQVSDENK